MRYSDNSYSDGDLFVIRRDGTTCERRLLGGHSDGPVFSPDGRWIAFRKVKNGTGGNIVALSVKHPGQTSDAHPRAGRKVCRTGLGAKGKVDEESNSPL